MKFAFAILLLTFSFFQNSIDKNYLLGRFDPASDSRFIQLTSAHAKGNAVNRFLRKEAFASFKRMAKASNKEGVNLVIVSGTRNFDYQKKIWEDKWNGKVKVEGKDLTTIPDLNERARLILLYSAMRGTSRHHWGTDIDLKETESEYFEKAEAIQVYDWLTAHASEFVSCQPYT